ncbi:MAG: hypothetical protein FWC36_04490 [Spirochaetes bacterium]|nr:hypothetical protein [Spirochaetota bacterium]
MKKEVLEKIIEQQLNKILKGITSFSDKEFFTGYNPLEKIRGGLFHWVAVPFNSVEVFCELRCPNATQIEQCGDISNITQEIEKNKEYKPSYDELIHVRNYQENICKIVFNKPTFDNIAQLVNENDFVISKKREELKKLQEHFEKHKDEMTEVEKEIIESKIRVIDLQLGFILPTDTMAFVTWWAMGNDISDIKKITKEAFLRAASLAKIHNKAPSDYISGIYTDYNKIEIDVHAVGVLEEFLKEQQIVNNAKHKWFGSKKKE